TGAPPAARRVPPSVGGSVAVPPLHTLPLHDALPIVAAAIRAGAKVALGTDSGISDHGQNLRELALLVEHGLSPEKALLAGTRDAAELLGQAERIGTLEPGKHADLVVCEGDPLTDISLLGDADNVVLVVQGGRTVKDTREQRTAGR